MPWVEKRRNGWIVPSQKDGKVTSRYFDDESEARYYARMGKPFPITSAGIINQLQESTGKPRKKRSPKLGDYALEVIAHDTTRRDRRLGRRGSIRPLVVGCSGWEPELPRVASPTRRPRWVSAFP